MRRLPGGGRRAGADRGRRRLDPRGRAVHGRTAAVRLRGAGRGVRVPVLRDRGGDGLLLRAGAGTAVAGVRVRGAGRPAGERDPGRQQRARPRDRPPRGQAHARGAPGTRAHAHAVHGDGRRRVPVRAAAVGARLDDGVAVALLGGDPAGARHDQRREHPHRRARAERRAGEDGRAAAGLLPAVRGRASWPAAGSAREAEQSGGTLLRLARASAELLRSGQGARAPERVADRRGRRERLRRGGAAGALRRRERRAGGAGAGGLHAGAGETRRA